MKSELIYELFLNNNYRNFNIVTDISQGLGINGVDFANYTGLHREKKSYDNQFYESETTSIVKLTDDYITLRVKIGKSKNYQVSTLITFEVSHIVAIQFFDSDRQEFPLYIESENNFSPFADKCK